MATNSAYIIQDLLAGIGVPVGTQATGGVYAKLSNRNDVITLGPQWIADAIIELSRSYPFEDLQDTGPVIQMTTGQYEYPLATFLNPLDVIASSNLVPSFYMFYNDPTNSVAGYNPGIGLTYKSIDTLELMFSTPGTPAYWSRWQGQIFIAPVPTNTYFCYMRYQKQHPFSKPAALTDPIMLPDEWREIAEYSAAMRGAGNLRMLDYAQGYKQILFGDPKKPGELGLIAARVSQMESDIVSNQGMRQIRPQNRK
jgi:hypothetical protein